MKFEIDFNHGTNDQLLESIGAKSEQTDSNKYGPFERYMIELNDFKDLERLLKILDLKDETKIYSAVISFDPPTIFLDDKV